jgi:urease accessory protein
VRESSQSQDWSRFRYLNDLAIASRETKELRLTDTAMGEALYRLLKSLGFTFPFEREGGVKEELSFVSLFAYAAQCWDIPYEETATGFTWSWLENQVAAATKLVPLGQTQAQQLLTLFQPVIAQTLEQAESTLEENIGGGLPALAIASALHETQYSRLFRS